MLYFKIFDRNYIDNSPVKGGTVPNELDYLQRLYHENKTRIVNYYSQKNFAVKNTHLISRIVENMPLMCNDDYFRFLPFATASADALGRTYELTSGVTKGKVNSPTFYGSNGSELLVHESIPVSKNDVINNWTTYPCVTALTHSRNDLSLLLPFGIDDGSKEGLSAVSINLLALNIKYREFVKEQAIRKENGEPMSTKNVFVSKYVIPGIVESDIDFRFLNILIDTFYGNPIIKPNFKHKFTMSFAEDKVERWVSKTLETITKADMDFVTILHNIRLIFSFNAADLLCFDNIPNTRQSNWMFVLSRLKYMCFLYDVANKPSMSIDHINDWKLLVKRLEADKNLLSHLTGDLHDEVVGYIEKINSM